MRAIHIIIAEEVEVVLFLSRHDTVITIVLDDALTIGEKLALHLLELPYVSVIKG